MKRLMPTAGPIEQQPEDLAFVTVIVTKIPRNEPDVVRPVETARCRRLRPAWV
jgi:hypothetical protein